MRSISLFLLLAFSAFMLLEAYRFDDETDRQALLEFKSQVSEATRVVLSSWNNSSPMCNWKGVTCGRKHKRVTRLRLHGLELGGVISPSIGNLSFLISLNLSSNSFGGIIPPEVGNLFRLKYLSMRSNNLGGGIPTSLANCSRLLYLYLYSNHLGKSVPSEIGSLKNLVGLYLFDNKLTGTIPASLGNLTSLRFLDIGENNMEGEIPRSMAKLSHLVIFGIAFNKFSGVFPPAIYNFSSLEYLGIYKNSFFGSLRSDFGNLLPKLQICDMRINNLKGAIPTTLSNISTVQLLGFGGNNFTGSISQNLGKLQYLQFFDCNTNSLGSYSSGDLEFLGALTNCTQLERLVVGDNLLGGDLPTSIANFSMNLNTLGLYENFITGGIPHDIGNLITLEALSLGDNMLTGPLPAAFGKFTNLKDLYLKSNRLSGEIPSFIGNITQLIYLTLSHNRFGGIVPPSIGNCRNLLYLSIGYNQLSGTIPLEIFKIPSLLHIYTPNNFLIGSLTKDVQQLQNLLDFDVSNNKLSGKLPNTLGNCFSLEQIGLRGNSFDGAIPDISGLVGVKFIDFSRNNLSGSIPEYFADFSLLKYLVLSNNSFEGSVPTKGIFENASKVFVFGNKGLCGGIKELKLKPCLVQAPQLRAQHSSPSKKVLIGVSIGIALLLMLFTTSVSLWWLKRRRKKNQNTNNPVQSTLEVFYEKISYGVIRTATNGFSLSNYIGSGSFGTVFKALLPMEDMVVAVKVLNMKRRGAMKSFMAECESLKEIRHRNLVKLLTTCSSIDFQGNEFRALIYEFMPNGSLDVWLHPEDVEGTHRPSRTLTLFERLNIAIDVAFVMDYLHFHCHEPIAHCDLKPSNVLLDNDLTAHVSDFGLARLLLKFDQESYLNNLSSTGIRGTIGYVAPEYGIGGQPSIHGDMYSFGVLLLEMFTGKRPTNELFGGNVTLHSYTKSALPSKVLDIADKSILHVGLRIGFPVAECLTQVLEVGLRCCEETPMNRLATSEVRKELVSIRERFFKFRRTCIQ